MVARTERRRHIVCQLGKDVTQLGLLLEEQAYRDGKEAFTEEGLAVMLSSVLGFLVARVLCTSNKCNITPRGLIRAVDRALSE
jgi:hypothetical protein